jgi:hypothetical protein
VIRTQQRADRSAEGNKATTDRAKTTRRACLDPKIFGEKFL